MKIKWTHLIELNRVLCNMVGQPHAVRYAPRIDKDGYIDYPNVEELSRAIANEHIFVEGNKRTSVCVLVASSLKDL